MALSVKGLLLARFPTRRNSLVEKKSRQTNIVAAYSYRPSLQLGRNTLLPLTSQKRLNNGFPKIVRCNILYCAVRYDVLSEGYAATSGKGRSCSQRVFAHKPKGNSMTAILPELEEAIRARAYQFWLEEGCPHGRHEIHWQRALASVTAERAPVAGKASAPVALAAAAAQPVVSDVSLIGGIGPKIKTQLAKAGIKTLADIASLSEAALAKLDAKLDLKGRSARDQWLAQARELLAGMAPRAKTDRARAIN
jgi:predicted flap endonuclease-1-like 5' DNA nuclease